MRLPKTSSKRDYLRMDPPAEQLIRDYLNRVSVAARGRLNSAERRDFLARLRESIERQTGPPGTADPADVRNLLSGLGDPGALVDRERERLAALTGELKAESRPTTAVHWPHWTANGAGRPGEPGAILSTPDANGSRPGGPRTGTADHDGPDLPEPDVSELESAEQKSAQPDLPEPDLPEPDLPEPDLPEPESGEPDLPEPESGEPEPLEPELPRPIWAGRESAGPGSAEPESAAGEQLARVAAGIGDFGRATLAQARRRPLEATAIVLMGLGGLIFPPVWLLGAALTLFSKHWDFRDRWVGLAGPVVLVIAGTGISLAHGGSHDSIGPYLHEAWMSVVYLSRLGAVLGAAYLTWRLRRGRREPPVPPWNRTYRF
jgi:hypothetical protein